MPCYKPISITVPSKSTKQTVPCGRCIGCRLEQSRQWAVRITLESKLYDQNSFILLTYDDDHVPRTAKDLLSLDKIHLQDFFRRLRYAFPDDKIRYFACGEYGEQFSRPHYHVCFLGFRPPELVPGPSTKKGSPTWGSEELTRLWGHGATSISDLTFESAAYVSRYCTKKFTNKNPLLEYKHYRGREPEFALMSRRPGIGRPFFDLYQNDIYKNRDSVNIRENDCKPPRYFDKLLEMKNPARFGGVKTEREVQSIFNQKGLIQLSHQHKNKLSQINNLKRSFENGPPLFSA